MHTRTFDIYSYDELDPQVRQKLLNQQQETAHNEFSARSLTEVFQDYLHERGFYVHDVRWSLSYAAGDGVAFYGGVDSETLVAKQPEVAAVFAKAVALIEARPTDIKGGAEDEDRLDFYINISQIGVIHDNQYSMRVNVGLNNYDENPEILDPYEPGKNGFITWDGEGIPPRKYGLTDVARELELVVLNLCKRLSLEMEKLGYQDIEYQTSEEVCFGQLRELGEVFTENGDLIG